MPKSLTLLALLAQLLVLGAAHVWSCPRMCTCDKWLLLRRANCTSVHTHSVSLGDAEDVQALDLYNNSITSLQDQELTRAGLTELRYLNLSTNEISEIARLAFFSIPKLAVLDLSSNRLEYIEPDTFVENTELQILKLNFNKFKIQVPKLQSKSIRELGLRGCFIHFLPTESFKDLPKLKKLDISYNLLTQVSPTVFAPLPDLSTIYLQENHWICDHSMRVFTSYLFRRKIDFQRVCQLQEMMPKGFDPMDPEKYHKIPHDKDRIQNSWDSAKNLKIIEHAELSSIEILRGLIGSNDTEESKPITVAKLKEMSPYWLVAIGFLLGSAVTIVVTYVLLSTTISCFHPLHRRCPCDSTVDGLSQRVSLLHNFWQSNGLDPSDPDQRPACPGTPPPPYREVMLHRNLYPNPGRQNSESNQATRT